MSKQNLRKIAFLAAAVLCLFLLGSCGGNGGNGGKDDPAVENTEQTPSQTTTETEKEPAEFDPVLPETEEEPEQNADAPAVTETETEPEESEAPPASPEAEAEPEPSDVPSEPVSEPVAKINGGADEVGIYSIVVGMTDSAADKGSVDMVYYGTKGSPQENSIVSTFRIEYYKEDAGTYEIRTFFDGEVYQNMHHKDEVKVVNTFSAALRAGNVIISYTPDGGETTEIFRADADYFRPSERITDPNMK